MFDSTDMRPRQDHHAMRVQLERWRGQAAYRAFIGLGIVRMLERERDNRAIAEWFEEFAAARSGAARIGADRGGADRGGSGRG